MPSDSVSSSTFTRWRSSANWWCAAEQWVGKSIPIEYKGELLTSQRLDMVVDEKVVVEIKSTELLPPSARRQTLNYLRATTLQVALLLHFGPRAKFYRLVQSTWSRGI